MEYLIDNESSQIEEVAIGSNNIYIIFSLFFLFCLSVYVYVLVCDSVCIALLLPFVLGFSLSFFFLSIVFSTCYHWWICFWFGCSFFIITFCNFLNNFLFFILITILFILFSCFFLSFFLPFILSRVDDRLLVLQPGARAVPLRWERQVHDTGPQETSQLHVISNGENLPEIPISTPRPSSTQRPASYSAGHPMPNS